MPESCPSIHAAPEISLEQISLNKKDSPPCPHKPSPNFAPYGNTQANLYWELQKLEVPGHFISGQPFSKPWALKLLLSQLQPCSAIHPLATQPLSNPCGLNLVTLLPFPLSLTSKTGRHLTPYPMKLMVPWGLSHILGTIISIPL